MDNKPPRSREILGPRPTPLRICKDSHKITKKPPLAQQPSQHPQPGGPVIIYTVSPKIIHTHPNNFMTLVQRLTGKISSSSSPSTSAAFDAPCGADNSNVLGFVGCVDTTDQYHHHQDPVIERPSSYHAGILSPGPTSLPSILPNFDPEGLSSFFNDFSSILHASPSTIPSPSSMDVFNNFSDS